MRKMAPSRPAFGGTVNDKKKMKPDPRQIRAARELLRWDQPRLAERAKVSLMTVKRIEQGDEKVSESMIEDLVLALEKAGIVFLADASLGGARLALGVALAPWAEPDPAPEKRAYTYTSAQRGRPRKDE